MCSMQCAVCNVYSAVCSVVLAPSTCLMTHLWRSQLRGAGQWEHYADLAGVQCVVYSVKFTVYSVQSAVQCAVSSVLLDGASMQITAIPPPWAVQCNACALYCTALNCTALHCITLYSRAC